MATESDVVVGSVWRWTAEGCAAIGLAESRVGQMFEIVAPHEDCRACECELRYRYGGGTSGGHRTAAVIAECAELVTPAPVKAPCHADWALTKIMCPDLASELAAAPSYIVSRYLNDITCPYCREAYGVYERCRAMGSGPPPRQYLCIPACTPAAPCMRPACPGIIERNIMASAWNEAQAGCTHAEYPRKALPPPELRAEREWGCGLARAKR